MFNGQFRALNTYQYVLDTVPNPFSAISLRRLSSTYSGPCLRIRRSNDNAESDIYFVGERYDRDTVYTFTSANTWQVYVVRFYDQSGNGNHRTQTTASNQPQFVWGGSAGSEVIEFNGSHTLSLFGWVGATQGVPISTFIVLTNAKGALGAASNNTVLYDQGSNQFAFVSANAGTSAFGQATASTAAYKNGVLTTMTTRLQVQGAFTTATSTTKFQLSLCNWGRQTSWGGLQLMGYGVTVPPTGGGFHYQGRLYEEINYYGNMDSKRVSLELNQMNYYDI